MSDRLYSHVLVPTDFGPDCQAAYRVALATARGAGAAVTLLHVVPEPTPDEYQGLDAIRLMHRSAERIGGSPSGPGTPLAAAVVAAAHIDRLRAEVAPGWVGPVDLRFEVRRGNVTEEVARYAAETGVDLIVTTAPRPGLIPSLGSGLAGRLARATPVKIVRVTPPVPA